MIKWYKSQRMVSSHVNVVWVEYELSELFVLLLFVGTTIVYVLLYSVCDPGNQPARILGGVPPPIPCWPNYHQVVVGRSHGNTVTILCTCCRVMWHCCDTHCTMMPRCKHSNSGPAGSLSLSLSSCCVGTYVCMPIPSSS